MNLRAPTAPWAAVRAGRGDTLMHEQGPNGLGGPLRGTSVWWHGRGDQDGPTSGDDPQRCQKSVATPEDDEPMIRKELVERVRREIAAGDYDTPARWEAALDRLLDRLNED